jgi:hypothetical protein
MNVANERQASEFNDNGNHRSVREMKEIIEFQDVCIDLTPTTTPWN